MTRLRVQLALALLALLTGCATAPSGSSQHLSQLDLASATNSAPLAVFLAQLLPPSAPPEALAEASLIADTALRASAQLHREYAPISSANLNNVLIRSGLKKRGLCYHWTNDLLESLEALPLAHFDLHWGVSKFDSLLHEHSSVIVTARGQPFATGILLDGWRKPGRLIWAQVSAETTTFAWRAFTAEELRLYRPGTRRPASR